MLTVQTGPGGAVTGSGITTEGSAGGTEKAHIQFLTTVTRWLANFDP